MPRNTTTYDLLISCPGDIQDELEIIDEVIKGFNRAIGAANGIVVNSKHWSTDSYPEAGGNPQELLNKQFINDCDILVAVLWTRFGTPTDKYGSGTEQEIEEAIDAGKQVFVYFSDKPKKPSEVDDKEKARVEAFRNKYQELTGRYGLYGSFDSDESFKREFTNHLYNYFLKQINKSSENNTSKVPKLSVKCLNDGIYVDQLTVSRNKILELDLFSDLESSIRDNIEKINKLVNGNVSPIMGDIRNMVAAHSFGFQKEVKLAKEEKDIIALFCKEKQLEMSDTFFYLGNLSESNISIGGIVNQHQMNGTEAEKEKYKCILKLVREVARYREYRAYLEAIKKIEFAQCVVCNSGTTFDEDIDIKIKLPKDCYYSWEETPIPGMSIIRDFLGDDTIDILFGVDEHEDVEDYSGYPIITTNFKMPYIPQFSLQEQKSKKELYQEDVPKYKEALKNLFIYKYMSTNEYDLLSFNIAYLKQNTNMAFPALIPLKKVPDKIEYEIRSKHFPSVVHGELKLHKA